MSDEWGNASAPMLRRAVGRSLRALGSDLDQLDEAVAARFGLHRTDLRCVEILGREGPLPMGRFAELAGVSTSAMTAVVDRVERAGYVHRTADPSDRRRAVVALTEQGREHGRDAFGGLMRETDRLLSDYSRADLELLARFLQRVRAVVTGEAEAAIDADTTRVRPGKGRGR